MREWEMLNASQNAHASLPYNAHDYHYHNHIIVHYTFTFVSLFSADPTRAKNWSYSLKSRTLPLMTVRALERLFPAVYPRMLLEVVLEFESLAALLTLELSLAFSMIPHVFLQFVDICKHFHTDVTSLKTRIG